MPKIIELYAFITTQKDADDEGILAEMLENGSWAPMVIGSNVFGRLDRLRKVAKQRAKITGKKVTLARFSNKEELEEFLP